MSLPSFFNSCLCRLFVNYEELLRSLDDYRTQLVRYHAYLEAQAAHIPSLVVQPASLEAASASSPDISLQTDQALKE